MPGDRRQPPPGQSLVDRLRDPRDRRSAGRSDEVVADVLAAPNLLPQLVAATLDEHRIVRMRAVDATEKVSRVRPELLAPHAETVLERLASRQQPEIRWHMAQLLPRLPLTVGQRARALTLMTAYLKDPAASFRPARCKRWST